MLRFRFIWSEYLLPNEKRKKIFDTICCQRLWILCRLVSKCFKSSNECAYLVESVSAVSVTSKNNSLSYAFFKVFWEFIGSSILMTIFSSNSIRFSSNCSQLFKSLAILISFSYLFKTKPFHCIEYKICIFSSFTTMVIWMRNSLWSTKCIIHRIWIHGRSRPGYYIVHSFTS